MGDIQQRVIKANIVRTMQHDHNDENKKYFIEGYAMLFEKYLYAEVDDVKIYEEVDRSAFEGADLSDFSLKIDHVGKVYARVKNGSLTYKIDSKGLFVRADLSRTSEARELYEAIKEQMYPDMSYAFSIAEEAYDKKTRTRIIKKFKKIYDVSVCDFGANSNTSVYARNISDLTGEVKLSLEEIQQRRSLEKEYLKELRNVTNIITTNR